MAKKNVAQSAAHSDTTLKTFLVTVDVGKRENRRAVIAAPEDFMSAVRQHVEAMDAGIEMMVFLRGQEADAERWLEFGTSAAGLFLFAKSVVEAPANVR